MSSAPVPNPLPAPFFADLLTHVLLTRFNLPSPGVESHVRAREGWLTRRVELFERYTVPSIRAQSRRNFSWLIYFDPDSPRWLVKRMAPYVEEGLFIPIERSAVSPDDVVNDIRQHVGQHSTRLITTNIDNDDGLAADFIERVQEANTSGARSAVYVVNGLILAPQGTYLRRDRRNAFCSVSESWSTPVTCWSDWHNLLGNSMPVVEVGGRPAWLQVVHGGNVSNRVRGRLVDPRRHRRAFGTLLDDAVVPSTRRILVDRALRAPGRWLREAVRGTVKRLAMRLVGKRGLDRLKLVRQELLVLLGRSPRGGA
jgi:N-acetylglucosaminyl-diphospho-decaprenol L-rhamnosyltransferase